MLRHLAPQENIIEGFVYDLWRANAALRVVTESEVRNQFYCGACLVCGGAVLVRSALSCGGVAAVSNVVAGVPRRRSLRMSAAFAISSRRELIEIL